MGISLELMAQYVAGSIRGFVVLGGLILSESGQQSCSFADSSFYRCICWMKLQKSIVSSWIGRRRGWAERRVVGTWVDFITTHNAHVKCSTDSLLWFVYQPCTSGGERNPLAEVIASVALLVWNRSSWLDLRNEPRLKDFGEILDCC